MDRKDLVSLAVLLEISDDYEEPSHIYDRVAERLGICQVGVNPDDVKKSLVALIESGLAKGYWLRGTGPVTDVQGVPPLGSFQDYHFWITDEGRRALTKRRHEWPLDDEDRLTAGWSPPRT